MSEKEEYKPPGLPSHPPKSRFDPPAVMLGEPLPKDVEERVLDLSDGADAAHLSVTVPPGHTSNAAGEKNKKTYRYVVMISKERMTESLLENKFQELWDEVEEAVLADVNKV
jgi:hypothetical protein